MADDRVNYSALSSDDQAVVSIWIEGFEDRFGMRGPAALEESLEAAPGHLRFALLTQLLPLSIDAYRKQHRVMPTLHELKLAHPSLATELGEAYPELPAAYRLPVELHGYRVIRVVGDGGQAVVLRAQDDVHSTVAIKLSTAPQHNELLLRERRILGECDHPGVVPVIGSGMHEGAAYFVMPFLKGKTLADRYGTHRPDAEEAARIIGELCGVVEHLHEHGILHRDIKPANVWVDDQGSVKLIDLGMAIERSRWGRPVSQLREFHGTPAFMSPEQAATDGEQDGELSDIFSVGATLYWLGTGAAPFDGRSGESALSKAAAGDYDRKQLETNSQWPKLLTRACLKAMSIDQHERYRSAGDFADALQAIVPVVAPKRVKVVRSVAAIALTLAAAAALALGLGLTDGTWVEPPTPAPVEKEASWIERTADREGIRLSALDTSSFEAEAFSTLQTTKPWGTRDFSEHRVGILQISCAPDLDPIAGALEYRIGDRPWRTPRRAAIGRYEDELSTNDLKQDGRLAIRLGGRRERVAAGPFLTNLFPSNAVLSDATSQINSLIQEAKIASCFGVNEASWTISDAYAKRYAPLITTFRFGSTLGEPLIELSCSDSEQDHRFRYAQIDAAARDLQARFSISSAGLQGLTALWTEIDFIDGTSSGPRRFRRRLLSDADQAIEARAKLASRDPEKDIGSFSEHALVPSVLADVAASLERIEIGKTADSLTLSRPVISEPNLASPNSILKNPSPASQAPDLDLSRRPYRIPALYAFRNEVYGGVSVPPTWRQVSFRGRFHDGTVTPTYSLQNSNPLPGYPIKFLSSPAGFPKTNAHVFAEVVENQEPENLTDYYPLPDDAPEELVQALKNVRVGFYAELPEGAAWFTQLTVLSRPVPKNASLAYQTIKIPYLDRYGRPFGSGTFRVATLDVRRAIEQALASQGVYPDSEFAPIR